MTLVSKCAVLLSCAAALVSPCAYDADSQEPSAAAAIIAAVAALHPTPAPSITHTHPRN
jgi:hypothetical protein